MPGAPWGQDRQQEVLVCVSGVSGSFGQAVSGNLWAVQAAV